LSHRSPGLPGPALIPARSAAALPDDRLDAAGAGTRLTTTASSLASSASVPTLTGERVPSRVQPPPQLQQQQSASRLLAREVGSITTSPDEARYGDLQQQLLQMQEALASVQRLAEERGQEVGTLLARNEMLLARISERDAEVLRLRAQTAKYQDDIQGRLGAIADSSDPQQVAALRLQRAIRPWLAKLRKNRDDASSFARDRWKHVLQEVEAAVSRALEHAVGSDDLGRVPRQTRLQLLGNTLKHGVLRVNQVMMQQTLQELRKKENATGLR